MAGVVVLGTALGEGEASTWVFLGLAAFFAVWGAQAVDAYRRAVERGSRAGGAIQILALAPALVVVFTGFWLLAASAASPSATLQRYVAAWRDGRVDDANRLFVTPPGRHALAQRWQQDEAYLRARLAQLVGRLGPGSGLRLGRPLDNLAFELVPPATRPRAGVGQRAEATADIVRQVTVPGSFFGLFPTASQRSLSVERVGRVRLAEIAEAAPPIGLPSAAWKLEAVEVGGSVSKAEVAGTPGSARETRVR